MLNFPPIQYHYLCLNLVRTREVGPLIRYAVLILKEHLKEHHNFGKLPCLKVRNRLMQLTNGTSETYIPLHSNRGQLQMRKTIQVWTQIEAANTFADITLGIC